MNSSTSRRSARFTLTEPTLGWWTPSPVTGTVVINPYWQGV